MTQQNQDVIDVLMKTMQNPRHRQGLKDLGKLLVTLVFLIPGRMLLSLLHTGGGRTVNDISLLITGSILLLLLSHWFQNLSGDVLFLLWGVFVVKWIAERVWLNRRQARGEIMHSMQMGVLLLSAIGVRSLTLVLLGLMAIGMLILPLPGGALLGLFLICGGVTGLAYNAMWAMDAREAKIRERDSMIDAYEREAAAPAIEPDRPGFQRVDVE